MIIGGGSAAVATGKGFDTIADKFSRHNQAKQEKLASRLGVKLEDLPKRRLRQLVGNGSKLTAKVATVGAAAFTTIFGIAKALN